MKKKRILILPSWYPDSENPLNGIFIHEQAIALSKKYEVAVLAVRPIGWRKILRGQIGTSFQKKIVDGITVYITRAFIPVPRVLWLFYQAYVGAVRSGIKRIMSTWGRPDLLHAHVVLPMGYAAVKAAVEYNLPVVLTEHSSPFSVHLQKISQRRMVTIALQKSSRVVAVSPSLAQTIQDFAPNISPVIIGNLAPTDYFTPIETVSLTENSTMRFLIVGFLVVQKGITFLLDAAASLCEKGITNFEIIIGGDGELRAVLEQQAEKLQLKIKCRFIGTLDRSQVRDEMRKCDVFILPSLHETFGVVLTESMACGKPVIATRCGGPEYVVTTKTGMLVETGNPKALADAMEDFILKRVAFDAKEIRQSVIQRFGEDAFLASMESVYEHATHTGTMKSIHSTIAILSFSHINRDARVLRQIECLSRNFAVAVIGYGDRLTTSSFCPVIQSGGWSLKVRRWICLLLGKFFSKRAYEYLYWSMPEHQQALDALLHIKPQIIHANDLEALPVSVRAADALQAKIVLDLHEYAPLEWEQRRLWRFLYRPYVEYLLHRYTPKACATITVADAIAKRYAREFGFFPITVLNIPTVNSDVSLNPVKAEHIRLIHHGGAIPYRRLDQMINVLALSDTRYELHFMLTGDLAYQSYLEAEAKRIAPGRVFFHPPVPPFEIVACLNQYDIGFYLLRVENYNDSVALPNKFFDFVQAGLAICIGPSPEMARLVREYNLGVVADSFEPQVVAAQLNALTADDIDRFKAAALEARQLLNADVEMQKLLQLYHEIIKP